MLRPLHYDLTPQSGWDSLQADGTLIRGNTRSQLLELVLRYRIEHGLPIANLAEEVDDEMCRRKPMRCAPPRPEPDGSVRQIGVADVWRFVQTITSWVADGTLADQTEAERRAEICAGCSENKDINDGSCWGCTSVIGMVSKVIGSRTTRMDHALKNCAVCSCFNVLSVWVPLPVLQRASGDLDYPADTNGQGVPCWRRADA